MDAMERPCIHVSLLAGADPSLYRWVEIGAEEEGVPARQVPGESGDLVSLAYQAAQSSRLNIGVGISAQAVALHERHMPARQPVLVFNYSENAPFLCRMMGANAARMVVHRPLHIEVDFPPPAVNFRPVAPVLEQNVEKKLPPAELEFEPVQLAQIIATVVRKLQERGL